MPFLLGKFFNLGNRSNTTLSNASKFTYPSNPPLRSVSSSLPLTTAGLRHDSLPPYPHPHDEFPFGPMIRSRREFNVDAHETEPEAPNSIEGDDDPFSDRNRASTSTIRRSQSQAPLSFHQNNKLGPLSQVDDEDNLGEVPVRRGAISTTRQFEPPQYLSTRSFESKSKPPLSPVETKEESLFSDDVRSAREPSEALNKGKVREGASSPAVEDDGDSEYDSDDLYVSGSDEEDINVAFAEENNVPVVPGASKGKNRSDTEHPQNAMPEMRGHLSAEEVARALKFYKEYWPVVNSAQGPERPEQAATSSVLTSPTEHSSKIFAPAASVSAARQPTFNEFSASGSVHAAPSSTAIVRQSTSQAITPVPRTSNETPYPTYDIDDLPFEAVLPEGHTLIGVDECADYWYLQLEDANGDEVGRLVKKRRRRGNLNRY